MGQFCICFDINPVLLAFTQQRTSNSSCMKLFLACLWAKTFSDLTYPRLSCAAPIWKWAWKAQKTGTPDFRLAIEAFLKQFQVKITPPEGYIHDPNKKSMYPRDTLGIKEPNAIYGIHWVGSVKAERSSESFYTGKMLQVQVDFKPFYYQNGAILNPNIVPTIHFMPGWDKTYSDLTNQSLSCTVSCRKWAWKAQKRGIAKFRLALGAFLSTFKSKLHHQRALYMPPVKSPCIHRTNKVSLSQRHL